MQVMQLQAQLVLMTQRAEAAEAATAAAAIQLSTAQQAAAAAKSAQYAAEEAYKAMKARSRLVDQRLAGDGAWPTDLCLVDSRCILEHASKIESSNFQSFVAWHTAVWFAHTQVCCIIIFQAIMVCSFSPSVYAHKENVP